ncbi:MAG TPA: hypothetical protein VF069_26865 [Streptosporangiaceae bacterium]
MSTSRTLPRKALAGALAVTLVTAAGCKSGTSTTADSPRPTPTASATKALSAMSAREILAATERAFLSARSVHVKGTIKDGSDIVAIDMRLTRQGARGTMRGPIAGRPVSMQMIATANALYLRGEEFWQATAGSAAARHLGNRWVAVPKHGAPTQLFLSLQSFSKQVFDQDSRAVKGKPTKIGGRRVIPLIATDDRSVLYIAATGTPYPVRIAEAGGKRHVDLGGYNAPVTIKKPAHAVSP